MSEIKKMYENADIESVGFNPYKLEDEYPPFTAEKQLLLLQWLLDKTDLYLHRNKTDFTYSIASGKFAVNKYKDLKESIASLFLLFFPHC